MTPFAYTDPTPISSLEETPDWSTRPWGRPTVHPAIGTNPNLVATCDFRYHGLKVRGVRVFRGDNGLNVNMPQKKFGDSIQNAVYFINAEERERFQNDVIWVYNHVFGRRRQEDSGGSQRVAV